MQQLEKQFFDAAELAGVTAFCFSVPISDKMEKFLDEDLGYAFRGRDKGAEGDPATYLIIYPFKKEYMYDTKPAVLDLEFNVKEEVIVKKVTQWLPRKVK